MDRVWVRLANGRVRRVTSRLAEMLVELDKAVILTDEDAVLVPTRFYRRRDMEAEN